MPVPDSGRVQRQLFGAIDTEWRSALEVHARYSWREVDLSVGYASYIGRAFDALLAGGYIELKREVAIVRPDGIASRPRTYYRRLKEMFYNTRTDARRLYLEYYQLDDSSKSVALEFYSEQYPWLSVADFIYPVQKPRWANGYVPYLIKIERVLGITVEQAEEKRHEWVSRLTRGMSDTVIGSTV